MRKKLLLIIAILLTATQGSMAMLIFVKTITNKTITIDVDNSSVTIYSVKELIKEKKGYSVESQILLSNGNVLDNDKTLNFYGIGKESTIYLRIGAVLTDGEGITALSAYTGQEIYVVYTRSFTSGKPSTVCLPFAYAPKTGETFYTFTGITKSGSEYIADMAEYSGANLVANTPYLFMPTGDADFSGTYAIPADLTAGTTTPDGSDWTFVGTYTEKKWETAPTGIYGFSAQNVDAQGISQGEFVKVGAYVRVKPMRCYLKYKDGSEDYAAARAMNRAAAADEQLPETIKVRLIGANGDVNAIGTLHTQTGEVVLDGWYTLDGTRLFGQPTRKGIYLNNGKKVVIK
ncbi:MAG: hypothetical protein IKM76_05160 [Prevotella sp.]|nr:hypothetical protein [Prevotella sp.]